MRAKRDDYDEIAREMEELKKDPKKWQEFIVTQADGALKHWPGRRTR